MYYEYEERLKTIYYDTFCRFIIFLKGKSLASAKFMAFSGHKSGWDLVLGQMRPVLGLRPGLRSPNDFSTVL